MINYKIHLKYDGTNYFGFAIQNNYRTIQGSLQMVLTDIFKEKISIVGSGRTDRGVHANEQVISFTNKKEFNLIALKKIINNKIDNDIEIIKVETIDINFNARFSAKSKTYKYIINNGDFNIFKKNYQSYIFKEINVNKMIDSSNIFLGEHNFLSFSTSIKINNIRTINSIIIKKDSNKIITLEINANGFLRHMARMIVAKLISIGIGKEDNIEYLLKNPKKGSSIFKAEPQGLYLNTIIY